jgi:outer membrane efflux protein
VSGALIAPAFLVALALAGVPLDRATADSLHSPAARAHRDDAVRGLPRAALFPSGALLELQRDNVSQLTATLHETRSRVLAGEVTRADLAEVEARLAAARSSLLAAQAQYAADKASYLAIIGASPAEPARKRAPVRAPRR